MDGISNILFHIFISGDNIIHKLTKQQSRLIVENQQRIAVRTEHISVLHGEIVCLHHEIVATEGAGLHEES